MNDQSHEHWLWKWKRKKRNRYNNTIRWRKYKRLRRHLEGKSKLRDIKTITSDLQSPKGFLQKVFWNFSGRNFHDVKEPNENWTKKQLHVSRNCNMQNHCITFLRVWTATERKCAGVLNGSPLQQNQICAGVKMLMLCQQTEARFSAPNAAFNVTVGGKLKQILKLAFKMRGTRRGAENSEIPAEMTNDRNH